MSARPREVFEQTSRFSLRDVVATTPSTARPLFRAQPVHAPATATAAPTAPGVSMKLNLSNLQKAATANAANAASTGVAVRPNLSFSFTTKSSPQPQSQAQPPSPRFNEAGQPTLNTQNIAAEPTAAARAEVATAKHDIMRLNAYVDELTTRLKAQQRRLEVADASLVACKKELQSERQNMKTQQTAFKKELGVAHETENALRAELATRPQRSALSQSAFQQAVGSVLADEKRVEMSSKEVQQLETKISALGDAKVLLESEIATMKTLREKAVADLEAEREKFSEVKANIDEGLRHIKMADEALAVANARKQEANTEAAALETKSKELSKSNAHFEARLKSANDTLVDLNMKVEAAKACAAEAEAIKLRAAEEKEAATEETNCCLDEQQQKLKEATEELSCIEQKVANAKVAYAAEEARVLQMQALKAMVQDPEPEPLSEPPPEPSPEPPPVAAVAPSPLGVVTGDVVESLPGNGGSTAMWRAVVATRFQNMAHALEEEAQSELSARYFDPFETAAAPPKNGDDTQQMIDAIVSDLKQVLVGFEGIPVPRVVHAI